MTPRAVPASRRWSRCSRSSRVYRRPVACWTSEAAPGTTRLRWQARGYDVTVLDRSADMLAVAAGKGLRTALGDATSLPVEDASVDAVTMISMLHQVSDWHAALREAQRVLEPGGPSFCCSTRLSTFETITSWTTSRPAGSGSAPTTRPLPSTRTHCPGHRRCPCTSVAPTTSPCRSCVDTHGSRSTRPSPVRPATSPASKPRTQRDSPRAAPSSRETLLRTPSRPTTPTTYLKAMQLFLSGASQWQREPAERRTKLSSTTWNIWISAVALPPVCGIAVIGCSPASGSRTLGVRT